MAISLNNLAALYQAKGDYGRAEPLYQRALALWEKALGSDHPDVAISLNNLAALYMGKGEYGRAEPLYQRALAIGEKALGPDHPDVAGSLNNLAALYWAMGRLPETFRFQRRAQEVDEKTLALLVSAGSEAQNLIYVAKFQGQHDATVDLALHAREPVSAGLALTTDPAPQGPRPRCHRRQRPRAARPPRSGGAEASGRAQRRATRYATLVLRGPGPTPLVAYQNDLDALRNQIQEHEAAISARSKRPSVPSSNR